MPSALMTTKHYLLCLFEAAISCLGERSEYSCWVHYTSQFNQVSTFLFHCYFYFPLFPETSNEFILLLTSVICRLGASVDVSMVAISSWAHPDPTHIQYYQLFNDCFGNKDTMESILLFSWPIPGLTLVSSPIEHFFQYSNSKNHPNIRHSQTSFLSQKLPNRS